MVIELNEQEAQALMSLLDLAVKAGGMNVAAACVVLTKKIQDASVPAAVENQATAQ